MAKKRANSRRRRRTSVFRIGTRTAKNFSERIIHVGNKVKADPDTGSDQEEQQTEFFDNTIKSSKYTIWTFIPRNLFEQFRRIANFYFLIVGMIQLLIDSPVSPFTSISPLIFVVTVTMIKQGYEDFMRHKADRVINHKLVTKVEPNGINQIQSQDVKVGDILCIEDGDDFPCDMLILSSSNPNGKVSIMTANLDGETNLKTHCAPTDTRMLTQPHLLNALNAKVECENANADLNQFAGRLKVTGADNSIKFSSLGLENVAFRGTQLKNTEFVYGCAIYTGPDTKMSQNSRMKANKFSSIEVTMNKYLIFFVSILVAEILVSSILKYTIGIDRPNLPADEMVPWYLSTTKLSMDAKTVAQDSLSFLVIFNYIIPISLYVTLEVQKFVGSLFLTWDAHLFDEATGQPAKCNSSDLNEELGQVEYLFSDKTGTLTENVMVFKRCSIDGILFKDVDSHLVCDSPDLFNERSVRRFLEILALCHTVQVAPKKIDKTTKNVQISEVKDPHDLSYNASSPDEKAIVEACRNYGVAYLGDSEKEGKVLNKLLVSQFGSKTQKSAYERLQVLEFDSVRKRMSVLLRDPKGNIRLVTKGAEVTVMPKCHFNTSTSVMQTTLQHINKFATEGLRTLAVAVKSLSEEDYEDFMDSYNKASQSLVDREAKVRAIYEQIEDNLELIGAIGVEDKLQEGVKDTLVSLGQAGIKVWILTGDKKETAINISWSCGHLRHDMQIVDIAGIDNPATVERVLRQKVEDESLPKPLCLIVDGTTVGAVFNPITKAETVPLLRQLGQECESVVCCRMSPLQKSEIVAMMKNSPSNPVTAAIGDGANDVAMIQEAHVGLGIMGKEGRAAVRSSDFAFAKFKHLKRVLLVHGHWYYVRAAILVQYFFYKNVAAFTPQILMACFNNFSTQSIYDSINLTFYNIVYTSLPIFCYGLFEQNLSDRTLMENPRLYRRIAKNSLLTWKEGIYWIIEALWHSLVVFFAFYAFWSGNSNAGLPGNDLSLFSYGLSVYQAIVIIVHLRLLFQAKFWSWVLLAAIAFSIVIYVSFTMMLHALRTKPGFAGLFLDFEVDNLDGKIPLNFEMYWVILKVLQHPGIWLTSLLVITVALVPYITMQVFRHHFSSMKECANFFKGTRVYRIQPVMPVKSQKQNTYINQAFQP